MNGPLMAWFSGLNAKADQAGVLAVYPDGTGSRCSYFWNAGDCCGPAVWDGVDDVAFFDALLDDLAGAYSIDRQRVLATGMSNGAMMAYRLAAELSDRIAAIAPVAGRMATEGCRPRRPVPVLHFHGTTDEFIPFPPGTGSRYVIRDDAAGRLTVTEE
jgi:polyhydroxybutyrate depolymerase